MFDPARNHSRESGVVRALARSVEYAKEAFMTWSSFYLICFLVGFGLSALALLAGSAHVHLPHLHFHHGLHVPCSPAGGGAHGVGGKAAGFGSSLSWFNFGTIAVLLSWFGVTGYLLEHYYNVW